MAGPSPPIDISTPPRFSSSSPRNQASNLTTALQADKASLSGNISSSALQAETGENPTLLKQDSSSSGIGSSHAGTGAKPISVGGRPRRESTTTGSYMNGMSWGGISVGSFLQDDVMMGGTSPYNFQSPSFHSSSYLPKMEANFWSNLRCCDIIFNDLHELLQHFEERHSQAPQSFPYRMSQPGSGRFMRRRSSANNANGGLQADPMRPSTQVRGFQSVADPKMSSIPSHRQPQQPAEGFNRSTLSTVQDMDTLGDMEMDDESQMHRPEQLQFQPSQVNPQAAVSHMAPLNTGIANMMQTAQGLQSSNPNTPLASQQAFARHSQHNPMVSSVNTPTFAAPQQQNRSSPDSDHPGTPADMDPAIAGRFSTNTSLPFNSQLLQGLDADLGNLSFGGNEMLDLCIDDPAKALFSEQGDLNAQQFPQFNFSNGSMNDPDAAKRLRTQQIGATAGMNGRAKLPGEEERPFKCPVIGCEKAYKNANGLRYHEKHGHASQKLKENGDGTFSIVDPVTSIPYPGSVGMEKEKPYRCEVCGKRYKNLNGLKYHRNHSPPCNPDFNFNNVALPGMQPNVNGDGMY